MSVLQIRARARVPARFLFCACAIHFKAHSKPFGAAMGRRKESLFPSGELHFIC